MTSKSRAVLAGTPADYRKYGLSETVAKWEDGARTDNRPGTYEWWYFDSHLDDGSILVIVFQNKDFTNPKKGLDPLLRLDLTLPDGRVIHREVHFDPSLWQAATDHADVRVGESNRFTGDLKNYTITIDLGDVSAEVSLNADIVSWRPETGYMLFGEKRDREFSWLPSVPQGRVKARYTVDGVSSEATGVGYHDHNWGNVALPDIIHNWYWARGQAGPYSVVASYITATKDFGFEAIPLLMLAKDGVVRADDSSNVTFERENIITDASTGKPVAGTTRYTHTEGDEKYVVTFSRNSTIATDRMIESLRGPKRIVARLARFDGAYLRFSGQVSVQHFQRDQLVDEAHDNGIWELMYFGHAR